MKLNTKKIKKEMNRLGWSQIRLAQEMGCKRQYVNYMLKNGKNPKLETIQRFAKALDVDPKDLISN